MSFLLDTDIIILWLTNRYPSIQQKITEVGSHRIFVSSITIAELYFGAYYSSRPDENRGMLDQLVPELQVLPCPTFVARGADPRGSGAPASPSRRE